MKYIPFINSPNISETRLNCISPSLKMDDRGFPCVSYLSTGNNVTEVNYIYWDGLKWSFYDVPKIYVSSDNIVFSPRSLVLDENNSPVIVFSRRIGSGYRLSLASRNNDSWSFSDHDVAYTVGWIGLLRIDGTPDSDFSSSSSLSLSISTSSSSLDSPSSDSSSSSSFSHPIYFVLVYDSTNEQFKVYSVDGGVWTLFSSINASVNNFELVHMSVCGNRMGVAYVDQNVIKYNFLGLSVSAWSFVSFQTLASSTLYGDIIDIGTVGSYQEDESLLYFGWTSNTSSKSYVNSVFVTNTGVETPSDKVSAVVESSDILVTSPTTYIVNGYRKIDLCLNNQNQPIMIATGATSKIFTLTNLGLIGVWSKEWIDVDGINNGIVPTYLNVDFSTVDDNTKISIAADSGSIYYFEPTNDPSFPMSSPDMVLLNNSFAYRSLYAAGQLNGTNIMQAYDNPAGSILTDTKMPVLIVSGNREIAVIGTAVIGLSIIG